MVAGIAQSQMLMEQRQKNRANNWTIPFHQKKVAAQRMLLDQLNSAREGGLQYSLQPQHSPQNLPVSQGRGPLCMGAASL
jgi:hypothetical protein